MLVALGGLVLPGVGTLIGLALVWMSPRWEHGTKVTATLITGISIAGGVVVGLGLAAIGTSPMGLPQALMSGRSVSVVSTTLPTVLFDLMPFVAALVLARRLRRPPAEAPA